MIKNFICMLFIFSSSLNLCASNLNPELANILKDFFQVHPKLYLEMEDRIGNTTTCLFSKNKPNPNTLNTNPIRAIGKEFSELEKIYIFPNVIFYLNAKQPIDANFDKFGTSKFFKFYRKIKSQDTLKFTEEILSDACVPFNGIINTIKGKYGRIYSSPYYTLILVPAIDLTELLQQIN